jgi:hypothetical protein
MGGARHAQSSLIAILVFLACCIVAGFAPKRERPACGGRGPIETLFGGLHQIDGRISLHLSEHSVEGSAVAGRRECV